MAIAGVRNHHRWFMGGFGIGRQGRTIAKSARRDDLVWAFEGRATTSNPGLDIAKMHLRNIRSNDPRPVALAEKVAACGIERLAGQAGTSGGALPARRSKRRFNRESLSRGRTEVGVSSYFARRKTFEADRGAGLGPRAKGTLSCRQESPRQQGAALEEPIPARHPIYEDVGTTSRDSSRECARSDCTAVRGRPGRRWASGHRCGHELRTCACHRGIMH